MGILDNLRKENLGFYNHQVDAQGNPIAPGESPVMRLSRETQGQVKQPVVYVDEQGRQVRKPGLMDNLRVQNQGYVRPQQSGESNGGLRKVLAQENLGYIRQRDPNAPARPSFMDRLKKDSQGLVAPTYVDQNGNPVRMPTWGDRLKRATQGYITQRQEGGEPGLGAIAKQDAWDLLKPRLRINIAGAINDLYNDFFDPPKKKQKAAPVEAAPQQDYGEPAGYPELPPGYMEAPAAPRQGFKDRALGLAGGLFRVVGAAARGTAGLGSLAVEMARDRAEAKREARAERTQQKAEETRSQATVIDGTFVKEETIRRPGQGTESVNG